MNAGLALFAGRELKIVPRLIFAFALVALMISAAYAPTVPPPTLLWSDPTGVMDVALSANGQYVAIVTLLGEVRFYGRSSSTPIWTTLFQDNLFAVAISADGGSVAVGGTGFVYFWANTRSLTGSTNPPTWTSTDLGGPIYQKRLAVSGDGNYVLAGGVSPPKVLYWADAKSKSGTGITQTWTYSLSPVGAVDISSDGDFVSVAFGAPGTNYVAYWKGARTLTGTQQYTWRSDEPGTGPVSSVAVSDDGNYVASSGDDEAVLYWANAKTLAGNPPSTWKSAAGRFRELDMSSDGKAVIAGEMSPNMGVYFWSGATQLTGKPQSPSWTYVTAGDVLRVVIDSAGDYMAAFNDLSGPPRVYFFDSAGNLKWTYDPDHSGYPCGLSISGDGGTLAVGTQPPYTGYLFDTGFSTVIPEYPLGIPLLAIFMIIAYGLVKRRTRNPKNI